ncbi:MAG: hypothetical protein SPJ04_00825 [Bdellovibrionota bacterium]|nr:hypothetical protein [Bdellovibrionota bacterium]
MSRKYTQFLPTQTLKQVNNRKVCNEQHVRVSRSMLYSEAFLRLNPVALKLYLILRIKYHKEEEQNTDFPFSKSLGVKVLKLSKNSEKSVRRGLLELEKKGFIERTVFSKGGGKSNKFPNRFKFSTKWKQYQ